MPIHIYDGKGALVWQEKNSKGSGKKTIELNIAGLQAGKYYISVFNGKQLLRTAELIRL